MGGSRAKRFFLGCFWVFGEDFRSLKKQKKPGLVVCRGRILELGVFLVKERTHGFCSSGFFGAALLVEVRPSIASQLGAPNPTETPKITQKLRQNPTETPPNHPKT